MTTPPPLANKLRVDGQEVPAGSTYVQLGDTIGAYRSKRLGFQLETTRDWEGRIEWNGDVLTKLGPRSRRTLRFDQAIPVPYEYPGHQGSDWFDGGLQGMDLAGVLSSPHDWDRMHARCPVFGLIDIRTGKPRALASIAMPAIGVYSLERVGPTSILPEFGETKEKPMNGQHDLRRSRWAAPADEFGKRDQIAVARDMALAWDREKATAILKGPRHEGSYEIGREFAFVLIACVDAGDRMMVQRLTSIAEHVQHPYGNLQLSSGGNPAPPSSGKWFSDAEAHYLTVALTRAGLKRAARAQADVSVANGRKGKYIEVGTGRGDQPPTDGGAWAAAAAVYDKRESLAIGAKWKIGPDYGGALHGPYKDPQAMRAKLAWWGQSGKTRTFLEKTA